MPKAMKGVVAAARKAKALPAPKAKAKAKAKAKPEATVFFYRAPKQDLVFSKSCFGALYGNYIYIYRS